MKQAGISVLVVQVALALCGCSHHSALDAVNKAYGGLTTSDEQPYFGDEQTFTNLNVAQAEPAYTDPVLAQPAYSQAEAAVDSLHYLFVAWGNLKLAGLAGTGDTGVPQDWSGSISLDAGALGVLRTVKMESHQSDGILPRTDALSVDWKSTIYGGVDGLLLKIAAPDTATVTVDFANGQTLAIPVGENDPITTGVVQMAGTDDGIVWAKVKLTIDPNAGCDHGYMLGRWHPKAAIGGVFHGKWLSAEGDLRGHLRGLYGERKKDGTDVMFGKWIDDTGAFKGLLTGTYGAGTFDGYYVDHSFVVHGRIQGVYFDPGIVAAAKIGYFLGTWQEACAAEPLSTSNVTGP